MQGEYITDVAWVKMLIFFQKHPRVYIVSEDNLRTFLEAIYWITRTGAQWRMLPEKYGRWNSVFRRFSRWAKMGICEEFMEFCIDDPDLEYVMLDATIVRAHPCASGFGEQNEQGLGRSKGGFTSKIHAKVDALGNPLKFIITAGQQSDIGQAKCLLGSTRGTYVLGDKGYDSDDLRRDIESKGGTPVIPGRSNRKVPIEYDEHIYKERHLVECFFAKIKNFRRIFSRFDKSAKNFVAFLSFAGAILWLR